MNRTQKAAWFGLAGPCFCIAMLFWGMTRIPGTSNFKQTLISFPIVVSVLFFVVMFFVMRKRQSTDEVAADERDKMIRTRAVTASFISLIVMLPSLTIFMIYLSNEDCMVNVLYMPPLTIFILLISMIVYSTATLVQYKTGGACNE